MSRTIFEDTFTPDDKSAQVYFRVSLDKVRDDEDLLVLNISGPDGDREVRWKDPYGKPQKKDSDWIEIIISRPLKQVVHDMMLFDEAIGKRAFNALVERAVMIHNSKPRDQRSPKSVVTAEFGKIKNMDFADMAGHANTLPDIFGPGAKDYITDKISDEETRYLGPVWDDFCDMLLDIRNYAASPSLVAHPSADQADLAEIISATEAGIKDDLWGQVKTDDGDDLEGEYGGVFDIFANDRTPGVPQTGTVTMPEPATARHNSVSVQPTSSVLPAADEIPKWLWEIHVGSRNYEDLTVFVVAQSEAQAVDLAIDNILDKEGFDVRRETGVSVSARGIAPAHAEADIGVVEASERHDVRISRIPAVPSRAMIDESYDDPNFEM